MKPCQAGMMGRYEVVPDRSALASAIGNTGVEVVSSPYIVGLLEEASHRAVRHLYEVNEATVGVKLELAHLAPAHPDAPLLAVARLRHHEGRRLTFEVNAYQNDVLVMTGVHERVLIRLDHFLSSGHSKSVVATPSKSAIEFFFDYHSPWSYFAATQIQSVAQRTDRTVRWRPMHLARLIERINGRRPLDENASFVRWYKADMMDSAERLGLQISYHPQFPLRPVRALRATAYAIDQGKAKDFVLAIMKAYWTDSLDISDPGVLSRLGESVGLDAQGVVKSIEDDDYKSVINLNTDEAQERGVFGAPTFICEGKLFWGHDRLDRLEEFAGR